MSYGTERSSARGGAAPKGRAGDARALTLQAAPTSTGCAGAPRSDGPATDRRLGRDAPVAALERGSIEGVVQVRRARRRGGGAGAARWPHASLDWAGGERSVSREPKQLGYVRRKTPRGAASRARGRVVSPSAASARLEGASKVGRRGDQQDQVDRMTVRERIGISLLRQSRMRRSRGEETHLREPAALPSTARVRPLGAGLDLKTLRWPR